MKVNAEKFIDNLDQYKLEKKVFFVSGNEDGLINKVQNIILSKYKSNTYDVSRLMARGTWAMVCVERALDRGLLRVRALLEQLRVVARLAQLPVRRKSNPRPRCQHGCAWHGGGSGRGFDPRAGHHRRHHGDNRDLLGRPHLRLPRIEVLGEGGVDEGKIARRKTQQRMQQAQRPDQKESIDLSGIT